MGQQAGVNHARDAEGGGGEVRGPIPLPRRRRSAFRPSPRVPARLCSEMRRGYRGIQGLKEAVRFPSPRPRLHPVRNGFPGLPGDRAARRADVRAQ